MTPHPITDFGHILTVLVDILAVRDKLVLELLLQVHAFRFRLWQMINGIHYQVKAIHVVEYRHIKGRRDRALFFVAANVQVVDDWFGGRLAGG